MGVDGIEIQQDLNDLPAIMKEYGDKLLIEVRPDSARLSAPDTTDEEILASAREMVDTFGAHNNPGPGGTYIYFTPDKRKYELFNNEVCRYSLEKYAK